MGKEGGMRGIEELDRFTMLLKQNEDKYKFIEFMVAMVYGSPLHITLLDGQWNIVANLQIEHPQWWGEMEINGKKVKNIEIVFETLKSILKERERSVKEIVNKRIQYGWTYEVE